jgi:two-component system chemotaxis sensor kinase CheA
VAATVGKTARLVIEGEDVEMDTALVEHVHDPLTHMIRNAVDHGIEAPDVRRAAGKDPCGVITLRARHDAGGIVIQVSDDGAGLRRDAIAARATALGIPGVAQMKERDLFALVMRPGFSTAQGVTDLSGRGVGMDVVERNVRALRGTIGIESREGMGTTFSIRLPLTVAIIDGFAVTAASETYVVPLDAVTECISLPRQRERKSVGVVDLRGAAVPYFRLRDLFHVRGVETENESLVLVRHEDEHVGLAVDQLLGVSQVVIKSSGKLLDGRPGLAGSTILGTGKVAFILDVPQLLQMAMHSSAAMVERSRALCSG